ncbi:Rv2231c family pyridoxal phosphate-dependent protein CobC [Jatrophihabitans fulvus]
MQDLDLRHHGDRDVVPGLVDLAVNVRHGGPPAWLADLLRDVDLAAYPDATAATAAVAARHGRRVDEVLLTAGAAEAFVLLARALRPRHAVVVHPQFTEPELALRAAGHEVDRVVLAPPFTLEPALVPESADLVVIGNPTNPTSVLHPAATLRALVRPGRLLVVDEAFADCVPGEPDSLAGGDLCDLGGVVVVRSLTKTWGLAGLRTGYVLGTPDLVDRLRDAQPHWAVSTPALVAAEACSSARAVAEATAWATALAGVRERFCAQLREFDLVTPARASFVLIRTPWPDARRRLLDRGFAVRRGDTFPGLGPEWIRVAVRDDAVSDAFAAALREVAS